MAQGKICIIYHLYGADPLYAENFLHFLAFGYEPDVDYFVIAAGGQSPGLPQAANITYIASPNHNHDYGGYSFALNGPIPLDRYDYFIFVNSSVRGPYVPHYVGRPWYEAYINKLNSDVALVGSTINILSPSFPYTAEFRQRHGGEPPFSHVQSMVFALRRERLDDLITRDLFNAERATLAKTHIITDYEILMSQLLIRAGFNIGCLLPEYDSLDYRQPHTDINPTSVNGDPCFEGAYFGRTLHPFETLFVKTNRNIYPAHFLDRITYSMIRSQAQRLPSQAPAIVHYLESKLKSTSFTTPMPSILDQVGHAKLRQILNSINAILAAQG